MAYVLNSTGRSRRRHRHYLADETNTWLSDAVYAERSDAYRAPCRPECQQPRPPRNVIYGGPCPPDPELECQPPLPPPPCDPIWYHREDTDRPGYAYYAQMGELTVDACEPMPFESVVREASGSFELEDGHSVGICRYGTYLASLSLTLPAASAVNAQITMQLDGEVIEGSTMNVNKVPGAPGSAFVQAVFDVTEPGAQLEVVSSSALNLIADAPCDALVSLTIVQIDGAYNHRKHDRDRFEHDCGASHRHKCNCHH